MIIFINMLLMSCVTDPDYKGENDLQPGDMLPQFEVVMNSGEIVTTESLRGYDSMIVFFNTECPDCREELPVINIFRQLHGDEVKIVCISRQEGERSIEDFWERNGITLPYSAQGNRDVYNLFAGSGIPRIYISGPDLVIRKVFTDSSMPTLEEIESCF